MYPPLPLTYSAMIGPRGRHRRPRWPSRGRRVAEGSWSVVEGPEVHVGHGGAAVGDEQLGHVVGERVGRPAAGVPDDHPGARGERERLVGRAAAVDLFFY